MSLGLLRKYVNKLDFSKIMLKYVNKLISLKEKI